MGLNLSKSDFIGLIAVSLGVFIGVTMIVSHLLNTYIGIDEPLLATPITLLLFYCLSTLTYNYKKSAFDRQRYPIPYSNVPLII